MDNRITYTNKKYDTTIIEIKQKDNITDFLSLENNIQESSDEFYIGNSIYAIQYPSINETIPFVSYGIISKKSIEYHQFIHYAAQIKAHQVLQFYHHLIIKSLESYRFKIKF